MLILLGCILLLAVNHVCGEELGLVSLRLEPGRERCFLEKLPAKTVALFKYSALPWNMQTNQPLPELTSSLTLTVTVRENDNAVLTRKQSKPTDRLFLTAATTGDHYICFQAGLTGSAAYNPNLAVKLAYEIFIGDAGDPHITAPVSLQLHELAQSFVKAIATAAEVEREQATQRVIIQKS